MFDGDLTFYVFNGHLYGYFNHFHWSYMDISMFHQSRDAFITFKQPATISSKTNQCFCKARWVS